GDGRREVYVATLGMPYTHDGEPHYYLFLDALSGQDGSTLWSTRLRRPGLMKQESQGDGAQVRPLAWWNDGADGWPQPLVPLRPAGNKQRERITYVVSAGTGRVMNMLLEVNSARIADFDGKGVSDLYWVLDDPVKKIPVVDTGRGSAPGTEKVPPRREV